MNFNQMKNRSRQQAARRKRCVLRSPGRSATCVMVIAVGLILLIAAPSPAGHSRWKEAQPPSITTSDRPWIAEAEFDTDRSLHATGQQTIVFNLEPRKGGKGSLRKNRIRFLVEEGAEHSFCIPEDDPHLVRFKLKSWKGRTVLNGWRGGRCEPRWLAPGYYELTLYHDVRSVPSGGGTAFLYRPRARLFRPAQATAPDELGSALPSAPDFIAFVGPNGYYVSDYSSPYAALTCDSFDLYPSEVWRLTPYPNSPSYTFTDGYGTTVTEQLLTNPAEFYANYEGQSGYVVPRFQFNDKTGWQFTLHAWWDPAHNVTSSANVIVDESDAVVGDNSVAATVFTAKYQGFSCPATCDESVLPLQEGEIALFSKSNYQGDAVVAFDDVENFADYNASGSAQTKIESVRVGTNTYVMLFPGGTFDGDPTSISVDTPSLSGTSVGDQGVMSWAIFLNARNYILASDTCVSCSLEGINLSNQELAMGVFTGSDFTDANLSGTDFTGADFTNTLLVGANLTDTVFTQAMLTNARLDQSTLNAADFTSADLTGATLTAATLTNTNFRSADLTGATFHGSSFYEGMNFSDAELACTSFSGSDANTPWDLTGATFDSVPKITEDFSCRLSLKNTKLNVTTFTADIWRYLDLGGATLRNDTGQTPLVLSAIDHPLDLSGAILSGVGGLSDAILDGANLGCASGPQGQSLCTQLIDTDLKGVSFKKAILADAALNGANLSFANLSEADLSGAQMLKSPHTQQSATLEGAMLKNANLSSADLSGSNLTNANWYSTSASSNGCPGTTWDGRCASGQGASLNSADLAGAYLSGLDLSDSTPQGANFAGAVLVGANLTGANLSRDPTTGVTTNFAKAFLHGADFTDAITTGVNFTSAYVGLSAGATLLFQLPVDNLEFTGYEPAVGSIEGCVEFSYSNPTTVPATASSNICPDAGNGPCTDTQWQSPTTPIENAVPPSTTDTINGLPNGCKSLTMDINWILN